LRDDLQINLLKGIMDIALSMVILNAGQFSAMITLFAFYSIFDIVQ